MIKISSARHTYPERSNFIIERRHGLQEYTFLHFYNSVKIVINGESIITAPHSVIIFNKATPQFFESLGPLLHDWFHFEGECSKILRDNEIEFDKIYYPKQYDFIAKITSEFEKECFIEGFRSAEFTELKFRELILKIRRALNVTNELVDKDIRDKLRSLRGEMFSSFDEKWSVSRMASFVNLSESHFFKVYKTVFGVSPIADFIDAKLGSAKNLLTNTNKSVEQIALELGYDNTTHFIRQFKKFTGTTPSKYRKI